MNNHTIHRRLSFWVRTMTGCIGLALTACGNTTNSTEPDTPAPAPATESRTPPVAVLRSLAQPLAESDNLDPLLERATDARVVLLGEASHGTSEFYTWRAHISRRLIAERGVDFIAVEGDWATLWKLNAYVKHLDSPYASARDIMKTFTRWPVWMWANEETAELIEWMRDFNANRPPAERVGFYGIDVYGEQTAMEEAVNRLKTINEEWAQEVAAAYACFDPYRDNMHQYARAVALGERTCQSAVEQAYALLQEAVAGAADDERYALWVTKMHTKVVKNAERHFRLMVQGGAASWNARVDHFFGVVDRLLAWYGPDARGVVWAHNTHIGDARASAMTASGQRNIGQLARQEWGLDAVWAVGFGTHRGTVQAGREWGAAMETMTVPHGRDGSAEDWMYQATTEPALFIFDEAPDLSSLMEVVGHRAIGVVYQPERERLGNYVPTILPRRYNAFIFIPETPALTPVQ